MQRSVWQHRLPLEAILDALVLAITRETNTHTWKAQRTKASNMADEPENMLAIVITPSMRKTRIKRLDETNPMSSRTLNSDITKPIKYPVNGPQSRESTSAVHPNHSQPTTKFMSGIPPDHRLTPYFRRTTNGLELRTQRSQNRLNPSPNESKSRTRSAVGKFEPQFGLPNGLQIRIERLDETNPTSPRTHTSDISKLENYPSNAQGTKRKIGDRSCLLAPPRPDAGVLPNHRRTTTRCRSSAEPPPDHHPTPKFYRTTTVPPPEARRSVEPPPDVQRSTRPPPKAQRSARPPSDARRSTGPPPETRHSAGPPPEARRSAEPPPDAQHFAGPPPDAQRSAGQPLEARCLVGPPLTPNHRQTTA
ncbi:hypothetical protein M5K25_013726 [Dendrobium thyrsiflorum]|uniref:Uncharacterized protein n=1 Tax=Dendrobium thyrsiflorum TaxID=117978 RepID=A0ABD0UTQ7_DENTH